PRSRSPSPNAGLAPAPRPRLHNRPGAAVLSGPTPLLEPAHDHHVAALREGLGGVLGLVRQTITVKNDASWVRLPDTATRKMARAIPLSVCRSSGWSVRLPAKLTAASVMVCPFLLPGRAVCPALGTGGRWTRGMPQGCQGQATEPTKSARSGSGRRPSVGSGAGLVGGSCGWGSGMPSTVRPDLSTLGVAGERGSHHERCSQLV